MIEELFEFDFSDFLSLIISSVIIYSVVIIYIRVLGKRSTSQFNNFDWIVTVSAGSIFASTIILEDVSITEGALSIAILLLLQFGVTKGTYENELFREIVQSTPQLLLYEGKLLVENMRRERISEPEMYAEIRQQGYKSVKQIYAIVLETNSKMSIIPNDNPDEIGFTLSDVQGLPDGLKQDLEKRNDTDN